jgi:hypothetical protein
MKLPRRTFLHLAASAAAFPAVSRIAGALTFPARERRTRVAGVNPLADHREDHGDRKERAIIT